MADADKMPWGEDDKDFDAEKARALIKGLREDKSDLQAKNATLTTSVSTLTTERDAAVQSLQDKDAEKLSDVQKLERRLQAAEAKATDAEKSSILERVLRKHPDLEDLKDLLTGADEAEIKAKAERLSKLGKPAGDENNDDASKTNGAGANGGAGRPTPALTPGHGGEQTPAFDAAAIAAAARGAQF